MFAILTLVVCLADDPSKCRVVMPSYSRVGDGTALTMNECLGIGGQAVAQRWLLDNPGHVLRKIRCSSGSSRPERAA